jgi:2-polyprenyl-6-methoxyphenol hydroxylase-like FAD-dependent oxidoreductase
VHPSTLSLLDELGLADEFLTLPHEEVTGFGIITDEGTYPLGDFSQLRGRFPFVAFLPQWDLLNFLATEARRCPSFELRMNAEVTGLVRRNGRATGVRYREPDGRHHEVRAALTVAADGRHSVLRGQAGLVPRDFGAPIDVLWFRLMKLPGISGPPFGIAGRVGRGRVVVLTDRGSYWQVAFAVAKGGYTALRAAGLDRFRAELTELLPALGPAIAHLQDWDQMPVLSVQVDRLARWHQPGLLFIGDAAHAMSPIGGVGINLAIQDATAAARLLAGPLRGSGPTPAQLARVRLRRWLPTALTQAIQRQLHQRVLAPALAGGQPATIPRPVQRLTRLPAVRALPGRFIAQPLFGEHPPSCARRRSEPKSA